MAEASRGSVLLVDDDEDLLALLEIRLSSAGYRVTCTADPTRAALSVRSCRPNLVVTDLRMLGMDGLQLLSTLRAEHPSLPIIMMTAHGTIPDAVQATQEGAFAFITKPIDTAELLATVERAMSTYGDAPAPENNETLIAHSALMSQLLANVRKIATTAAPVLISGATGTGKDRIAQLIHQLSDRSAGAYVPVNCGAIPEALFEAELFGHARGAFTNAAQAREGLMTAADGGTLFLDEVGDLPLAMQVKLLRALESGEVRPVGRDEARAVDVRILAATNRDLSAAMETGDFREDLYYRLNVVSLRLPSLQERPDDIAPLANHFLAALAQAEQDPKVYSPEAMALLVSAPWPGNIRQLRNVVEQNVTFSAAPVISASEVRLALGEQTPARPKSYDQARQDFSRDYLMRLLQMTDWNVSRAARLAKRNRTDFYKLMERHGIDR